jgi:chromosome segregation ATPase
VNREQARTAQAKYERKIQELHGALETAARTLSERQGRVDALQSQIAVLEANRTRLEAGVAALEESLATLSGKVEERRADLADATKRRTSELGRLERRRKSEERRSEGALAKAQLAKEKAKETADVLLRLDQAKRDLGETEKALSGLRKESERIEKRNAIEAKSLEKREAALDQKLARLSNLRAETEKGLRTLEHYVKRLQRRYDQQGMRIDLLAQFNITRDR